MNERTAEAERIAVESAEAVSGFEHAEVGWTFRDAGTLYHVRGRVDRVLVARWWSRSKQRWVYDTLYVWDRRRRAADRGIG